MYWRTQRHLSPLIQLYLKGLEIHFTLKFYVSAFLILFLLRSHPKVLRDYSYLVCGRHSWQCLEDLLLLESKTGLLYTKHTFYPSELSLQAFNGRFCGERETVKRKSINIRCNSVPSYRQPPQIHQSPGRAYTFATSLQRVW